MFLRFKKLCSCKGLSCYPKILGSGLSVTGEELVISQSLIMPPVCSKCNKMWSINDEDSRPDRTHEECGDCLFEDVEPPKCLGHSAGETHCNMFVNKECKMKEDIAILGYCPICGSKGKFRERRINGDDICENGCRYPSKNAVEKPLVIRENNTDE